MKISVVTICLNNRSTLQQAIDSVRMQSGPEVELVIVDGGSSDGSVEIVQQAAEGFAALTWVSEPDRGISDAMNKGARLASGEIVAFLHADDFYPDGSVLQRVAETFEANPAATWLTGGIRLVGPDGEKLREIEARDYSFRRLVRSNIIFHPATFVRRGTLLELGGFRDDLRYAMDYDLWLRLGEHQSPLTVPSPLCCFRVHPGSLSSRNAGAAFAEEQQVRLDYLRRTGGALWPHRLWYRIKQPLNARYYRHLLANGGER